MTVLQTIRASPVFVLAVLITLGLAGLNGGMVLLMQLQPGFMGMAHFTEPHHRIHDLTFGFLFLPAVIGMLSQLRRPSENVAGMAMALVPWGSLVLVLVLVRVLTSGASGAGGGNLAWFAPAATSLVAAILHPRWNRFFRSFSVSRISQVMLALVAVAAVPLLTLAAANVGLQGTIPDDHAQLGHYGFMAAFGFTVIGVGLVASLRPDGWRLTAWIAGLLPVLLGVASLVYPDVSSTLGPVWAMVAIVWGAVFVAVAERARLTDPTPSPSSRDEIGAPPPATPRWVTASGVVLLALVLLVIGSFLTGTSVAGVVAHRPPAGGHR